MRSLTRRHRSSETLPKRVKLLDTNFRDQPGASPFVAPRKLVWDRERAEKAWGRVVLTDKCLWLRVRARRKIAWLVESPDFRPYLFDQPDRFYRRFDVVITCKRTLVERGGKFRQGLFGSTHLREEDFGLWPKSRDVSMIASTKRETPAHDIRHDIADAVESSLDLFGRGRTIELPFKIGGLRDYRFSVTVENAFVDYYFTEKLIDCFLTGTVPIYLGAPSIGRWFDTTGMVVLDGPHDIERALAAATPAAYEAMLPAVRRNFELAQQFVVPEDRFVDDGLL